MLKLAIFVIFPRQEILQTLYLTQAFLICHMHRASREVEGMSHNGSQNSETSCSSTWAGKFWWKTFAVFKMKLKFLTNIVLQTQLKQGSNSQFVINCQASSVSQGNHPPFS